MPLKANSFSCLDLLLQFSEFHFRKIFFLFSLLLIFHSLLLDETGETSYVNINYDKLIKWATGNKTETIENNRTSEYPIDVFIGNQHDYLMNPQ